MEKNEISILFSCDAWKTDESKRIIGIFNDERELRNTVCEMFINGEIEFQGMDIKALEEKSRETFNDYFENPDMYDEDINIGYEMIVDTELRKKEVFDFVKNSSLNAINVNFCYITIETFNVNETKYNKRVYYI